MKEDAWQMEIGARVARGRGTSFRVWAPKLKKLAVRVLSGKGSGEYPLQQMEGRYFGSTIEGVGDGDGYLYILEGGEARPDPASRFQPEGVHGASQVVDPGLFSWDDQGWSGVQLEKYLIYELHVGTFSEPGSFDGVIPALDYLKDLGITALEIMPVAQFPGTRNWGYDGAYPFAPQNSYGGPYGLKKLVNACHRKGIAVVLDVVYNHLGPEGNYLGEFGFYFTDRYRTPWGNAINFDGPHSDQVCDYFIQNALYWIHEFHVDALRLDAVHGIFDFGAKHFLRRLADQVRQQRERLGREVLLIAESDLNDVRVIDPPELGGHGIDAQWNDDFHHAIHALLTGEKSGYYQDFGKFSQLVKAFDEGFVYSGGFSPHRMRSHGNSAKDRPTSQFVVCTQNHDQVGNRMTGDRSSATLALEKLTLSAALVLLSPYVPLLFMGEEYGEKAPFQYFVSHGDPALIEAVRQGRRDEFACFAWQGNVPDPQEESTFLRCKITPLTDKEGDQLVLSRFYRALIRLRQNTPSLRSLTREGCTVTAFEEEKVLAVQREAQGDAVLLLFSLSEQEQEVDPSFLQGDWEKLLDSGAREWGGKGETAAERLDQGGPRRIRIAPFSAVVYRRTPCSDER